MRFGSVSLSNALWKHSKKSFFISRKKKLVSRIIFLKQEFFYYTASRLADTIVSTCWISKNSLQFNLA
jgi:hypothetical protein